MVICEELKQKLVDMDEKILKRMYDLAYCAGVNNTTRPVLKNKGLTYDECLQKIKEEQLTIHSVVVPKGTLFCDCLTPELLGRYTELKDVCKCGKTVAK